MSKKPIVLATRKLPPAVEVRLKADYDARLNATDRRYSSDELVALADGADAILPCHTESLSAEVIGRLAKSVRLIASFSVGLDHIDLAAARKRGLAVTNTPDVLSDATAEIAMLLLLGAARRGAEGDHLVRSGGWREWNPTFMLGTQVSGKRLGIVGMGRVGQVVARRARGFDMEIHYYNRRRLEPAAEAGAVYHDSLEGLLKVSQFLSINSPATAETKGMFDARRLALLPEGAIVVNTARGALVDDEALIAALKSRRVAAAGLDVFNNEPDIHPGYAGLPNTFLLPHLGSATRETRDAMGFRALSNIDAFFAGRPPPDRVA
jgi:lactate dehydrogenase-like 2-hydroxyacid dehydrogenase